ncbi:PVC-type heme-binding CxxCH protein [Flavilitoribacter nigricans]|uniref:Cytochrome c domain-containing protein n=1 Tax=Flavilitoribacter nigricans (strain ATCC 23147 / DSM 23189 / NBRC 102662 / NCIMB 1420 / SS-2) TaxID=1122177 RepID=A0A2D0NIU6_FLAN2|nr:PVC-type heme-binding CxxCH protein [Flavilitoribacter nigricans]PHN08367.1 hypothetical protein CRP01_00195 [Flavilitoribacter nigricans DSM 23189 = NBRC 102662]
MPPKSISYPECCFAVFLALFLFSSCGQTPEEELPGFVIHPDFRLEVMAAEPLVMDPVDLQFDAYGRAFVLEMPGYPLRDAESRLILLEDTDQDGQYDRRQVFADKLQLASSFMPYREGFLVAAPPDLLYIRDTDDDRVADDYQVIMSGFSTGNLQHNFNGLTYGLDNWLYAANGGNSGEPYFAVDPELRLDMRGDDFRFQLMPDRVERVGESSGGYGLAFDQWGHMYETHNLEHVSHLVFENRYLEGVPANRRHALTLISDHDENGLSRIYPIGEQESRVNHPEQSGYFSGSCGITFYGGGAFPDGFNDHIFVADVVLNLIHLDVLSPDGAAFKTSRKREKVEFLASTDRAFRPVNLTTGPDGALYVLDIHRDVIEHPEWIPDEIEATLDLNAGKDQGRIYRISPRASTLQSPSALAGMEPEELVKQLANPNQWTRMTAQRLLVEKAAAGSAAPLETLLRSSESPLARLHAMWTLEGLSALNDEILRQALGDAEAGVRENAIRIAEKRLPGSSDWIRSLLEMTKDENARVRMQAALALSTITDEQFQATSEALIDTFQSLLQEEHAGDQWLILATATALKKAALPFTEGLLAGNDKLNDQQLEVARLLNKMIGKTQAPAAVAGLLGKIAASEVIDDAERARWVDGLAAGWSGKGKAGPALVPALESLERNGNTALIRAAGHLREVMGLPVSEKIKSSLAQAKTDLFDNDLSPEERLELLKLTGLDNFERRAEMLYQLLDNRQPLVLQQEALRQLRAENDESIGDELLARWASFGPESRKGAGNILLYKAYNHDRLLSALENGKISLGELNFDLERRRELLFSEDAAIRTRAEALFSDAGVVTRKVAMDKMRPALDLKGNVAAGKEVFGTLCGTCHRYGATGQDVGPVLTEIQRKSKASLLHDILDPNAAVDTKYLSHRVQTKNGDIYVGIVEQETDAEITLKMLGGQAVQIPKQEVETFASLGQSLMPEGLEAGMSEQDLADLLAFLQQEII